MDILTPFAIKDLHLKNRIVMPPMCNFNIEKHDGIPTDWHFTHYASRAIGGCGLIIIEMTNVEGDGRITNRCMGLWNDEQQEALARIVKVCHDFGAKVGIQIGHAGRKAEDAIDPVAPSAIAFSEKYRTPRALTTEEVEAMVLKYQDAVARAVEANVDTIEIHGAHGYLIHQFHSQISNIRTDKYGKDLSLFGCEVIKAAKSVMPKEMPLIMRISAREYIDGGYDILGGIKLCKKYLEAGVDVFHISSGGEGPIGASGGPGAHAGYQVPLARKIKEALDVPVIAVGRLESPHLADAVIGNHDADLVAIGRGVLRNPNWTIEAAKQLGKEIEYPNFAIKAGF